MQFFKKLFHWPVKECGVVDGLINLLSVRQLQELVAEAEDPRALVDLAIKKQKLPRKKFLAKLSLRCCFPIKEFDDQELNLEIISLLPVLRLKKLGCFPLIRESKIYGLWCVDPYTAKQSLAETSSIPNTFPFFLGTWQSIQTKWEEFSTLQEIKQKTEVYTQQIYQEGVNLLVQYLIRSSRMTVRIDVNPDTRDSNLKDLGLNLNSQHIDNLRKVLFGHSQVSEVSHPEEGIVQVKLSYDLAVQEIEISIEERIEQQLDSSTIRVVVVDDSPVFAELIKKYLKDDHYQYKVFASSDMALSFLKRSRQKIHLIISDLHMPGLSGSDFLRSVRRLKRLRKTPFALLTSDSSTCSELSLLEQGVSAYLRKDQSPQIIAAHIKNIICQNSMP